MSRVVRDVLDLLLDGQELDESETSYLWDEREGAVLSGRDYSEEAPALVGITGSELPYRPPDW